MSLFPVFFVGLLLSNVLSAAEQEFPLRSGHKNVLRESKEAKSRARSGSDSDDDGGSISISVQGDSGSSLVSSGGISVFSGGNIDFGIGNIDFGRGSICIVNGRVISSGGVPLIMGSGKVASKKWTLGESQSFTGIQASGPGALDIIRGESDEIIATADDNIIEKLLVSLKGQNLACELESNSSISPRIPITYTVQLRPVTLALLTSIATSITTRIRTPLAVKKLLLSTTGTNALTAEEDLKVEDELCVKKSGTGTMNLRRVLAQQLMLDHSGTGELRIASGGVPFGMFDVSGTGSLLASNFAVKRLMLNMSGTGSLQCNVENAVTGSLSGTGLFTNYGVGDATGLRVSRPARYQQVR